MKILKQIKFGKLLVKCYGSELDKVEVSSLRSALRSRGLVVSWSVVRGRLQPAAYGLPPVFSRRAPKTMAKSGQIWPKVAKWNLDGSTAYSLPFPARAQRG